MADPKKAIAKTYKDAYGEGSTRDRKADRFSALDDSQLGGSFTSLGKKNGRTAYRDRRSGKTFYVNSRGELIKGSGEKDTSRWATELEGRITGAVDKKLNMEFEAEQTRLGNRPHDPDAGKDLQEQLTSRGIAEGKSVGEAQLAADQVEREDRRAYAIKNDLEGSQGYADPDEVARRSAGVRTIGEGSPVTKKSPLTKFVNPYAGNYSALSQAVGSSVDQAVGEVRDRAAAKKAEEDRQREIERQDLNQEIQRNTYVQQKIKQNEALIVPGDTGYNNVDIAVNNATRSLTDRAGALTANLKKGKTIDAEGNETDYDIDMYAQDYAEIQAQVPGIKKWKETLSGNLGTYAEGLQQGTLSKANGLDTNDLYASLMDEDGSFTLDMDGNRVVFSGTTKAGKPVMIPVNGSARMPKPVLAQPAPHELLKAPLKELQKQKSFWDTDSVDFAKQQLDSVLDGPNGDQALLSLAVDHYDISLEQAKKLELEPAEGFQNALEQLVEDKWVKTAETSFLSDQLDAAQKADLAFKQQQLQDRQKQGANASLLNFYDKQGREKQNQERFQALAQTPGGLVQYAGSGKGALQNITYDDGVGTVWNSEPEYTITLKGGETLSLPPNEASAYIANTLGIQLGAPQQQGGDSASRIADIKKRLKGN